MRVDCKVFWRQEEALNFASERIDDVINITISHERGDSCSDYVVFYKRKVSRIKLLPGVLKGQFRLNKIYECVETIKNYELKVEGEDGYTYIVPYSELDTVWEDVSIK